MTDLFQEFKKANLRRHLTIGACALVMALGVNVLIFNTDAGVRLQTSAIEATTGKTVVASPDISLVQAQAGTDRVQVQIGKAAQGVKSLEFTVLVDPAKITLGTAEKPMESTAEIVSTSNIPGVMLLKLRFATPVNIAAGTNVANIAFTKQAGVFPMNIASPRMITTEGDYELSSAWVDAK